MGKGQRIIQRHPEFTETREIAKLKETKIYAYIHRGHQALGRKIAATLEQMKQDGSFAAIKERVDQHFAQAPAFTHPRVDPKPTGP